MTGEEGQEGEQEVKKVQYYERFITCLQAR